MPRKTLIFGNGLGMALDPTFFSLDEAIGRVWDGVGVLDEPTRALVRRCLVPDGDADRPHGEEDLDHLQLVVSACELLCRTGTGDIHWLSELGRTFPTAVRKFLYKTAIHFHQYDRALPESFTSPLAGFIRETDSHMATLNYDNLLYQPMIQAGILSGYNGALVDGVTNAGFSADNMVRFPGRRFGYYLHLHGSPLFVDRDGAVIKLRQNELDENEEVIGSHIVLTHVKHKETVISASKLLSSYWEHFSKALAESAGVVLIGYSGCDKHLNALLRSRAPDALRVVEWDGAGAGAENGRQAFWNDLLAREVELVTLANILEFSDW